VTAFYYPSSTIGGVGGVYVHFGAVPETAVAGSPPLSISAAFSEWVDESHELAERFLPAYEAPDS
jgi:hypothetical protein